MTRPVAFDERLYWKRTLRRILVLLAIWLLVGPIMSIVLVEPLNAFTLGGIACEGDAADDHGLHGAIGAECVDLVHLRDPAAQFLRPAVSGTAVRKLPAPLVAVLPSFGHNDIVHRICGRLH